VEVESVVRAEEEEEEDVVDIPLAYDGQTRRFYVSTLVDQCMLPLVVSTCRRSVTLAPADMATFNAALDDLDHVLHNPDKGHDLFAVPLSFLDIQEPVAYVARADVYVADDASCSRMGLLPGRKRLHHCLGLHHDTMAIDLTDTRQPRLSLYDMPLRDALRRFATKGTTRLPLLSPLAAAADDNNGAVWTLYSSVALAHGVATPWPGGSMGDKMPLALPLRSVSFGRDRVDFERGEAAAVVVLEQRETGLPAFLYRTILAHINRTCRPAPFGRHGTSVCRTLPKALPTLRLVLGGGGKRVVLEAPPSVYVDVLPAGRGARLALRPSPDNKGEPLCITIGNGILRRKALFVSFDLGECALGGDNSAML
jgi:hypothetical protein